MMRPAGALLSLAILTQVANPYRLEIRDEGTAQGRVSALDCAGAGVSCSVSGGVGTVTVAGGGGGAPTDAQYWTGAADATLSAEKNLGALATGLVVNTAGTPSAYAGTSCTNQFPRSLSASGAATCATVGDADVANSITLDNLTQITTRAIADTTGTLGVGRGGTNLTAAADDNAMVGDGTTWQTKALPSCSNGTTSKLLYDTATNAFSCGTDQTGGGGGTTHVVLGATVTNATTSYANITGISWSIAASTRYEVECHFLYSANATTTGIGIGWTGPASPTMTTGRMVSGLTTQTIGGTTVQGNDTGATTTASVATTGNHADFHGTWSNGANLGTLQMRFKSEVAVANAIVLQVGSWCKYSTY